MTIISQIITDAYRESNLIALGTTPNDAEKAEALRRLQSIILASIGNEAGEPLETVDYPPTVPEFDPGYTLSNVRLAITEGTPVTIVFPLNPLDGARMGVIDPLDFLPTTPVVLDGNGRTIEGSPTITLVTAVGLPTWFYRADMGDWIRLTDFSDDTDEMPFPQEFDDFFVVSLAMRINPRYGRQLDPMTLSTMNSIRTKLRARYKQNKPMPSELALWINPWYQLGSFTTGTV